MFRKRNYYAVLFAIGVLFFSISIAQSSNHFINLNEDSNFSLIQNNEPAMATVKVDEILPARFEINNTIDYVDETSPNTYFGFEYYEIGLSNLNNALYSLEGGSFNFSLRKYNESLDSIWNKTWGDNSWIGYYNGGLVNDGTSLYGFGAIDKDTMTYFDFSAIKWDQDGNEIWNRTYDNENDDIFYDAWVNTTDLYMVGLGNYSEIGSGFIASVNPSNGNMLWNATYAPNDTMFYQFTCVWAYENLVFAAGEYYDAYTELERALLVCYDADTGQELWAQNNITWVEWSEYHEENIRDIYVADNHVYLLGEIGLEIESEGYFDCIGVFTFDANSGILVDYWEYRENGYNIPILEKGSSGGFSDIYPVKWLIANNSVVIFADEYYMDYHEHEYSIISLITCSLTGTIYNITKGYFDAATNLDIILFGDKLITSAVDAYYEYSSESHLYIWDCVLPTEPIWITASGYYSLNSILLQWNTSDGSNYFALFVNGQFLTNVMGYSYQFNLTHEGVYTIGLYASNVKGNSEIVYISVYHIVPHIPSSPSFLSESQTIRTGNFTLEWTDGQSNIANYFIYINQTFYDSTTKKSYQFVNLDEGLYHISLTARNSTGESAPIYLDLVVDFQNETWIILSTILGAGIGIGASVAITPENVQKFKDNMKSRKSGSNMSPSDLSGGENPLEHLNDPLETLNMDKSLDLIPTDSAGASIVPGSKLSFKDLILKLIDLWEQLPADQRQIITKLVDKYMRFADQATLAALTGFSAISTRLMDSGRIIRDGKISDALKELKSIHKDAEKAEFKPLAQDADASYEELKRKQEA